MPDCHDWARQAAEGLSKIKIRLELKLGRPMPMALTTRAVAAVAGWALHFLECARLCGCVFASIHAAILHYTTLHYTFPRPCMNRTCSRTRLHTASTYFHPVSTVSGLRAKLVSAACGPYFAISRHSTRGGRSRDAIPTPRKGQKSFLGPKPALPCP